MKYTGKGLQTATHLINSLKQLRDSKEIISFQNTELPSDIDILLVEMRFLYKGKELYISKKIPLISPKGPWIQVLRMLIEMRKMGHDNELRMFNLLDEWKKAGLYGIVEVAFGTEHEDAVQKADLIVVIEKTLKVHNSFRETSRAICSSSPN